MNSQTSEKLALHGGSKTINKQFKKYNTIDVEEVNAGKKVLESGVLSGFLGSWADGFYGGEYVKKFEQACEEYFNVEHAITVNSWTSGLIAAVGAVNIEPGDEVIVTPWTMSASATAILHWNGIPVFADIEPDTFNIDPESILKNISPYTKAILAVDIFGHSADMDLINSIAKEYGLKVISDCAQSPGAIYKQKYAGTLADVGGYSLNYHKHIHTGEGGIIVTNDPVISEKLKLIRNHAEAVVDGKGETDLTNMLGYNFRLGEIESAIGIEQLKKLDHKIKTRQYLAEKLNNRLGELKGLKTPIVKDDCTHVYYAYPLTIDSKVTGVHKNIICDALRAEGVQISNKYQNIHLNSLFQKRIAYGSQGFPWSSDICKRKINYEKGICPVAEKMNEESYVGLGMCINDYDDEDIELISNAFEKVWNNMGSLK